MALCDTALSLSPPPPSLSLSLSLSLVSSRVTSKGYSSFCKIKNKAVCPFVLSRVSDGSHVLGLLANHAFFDKQQLISLIPSLQDLKGCFLKFPGAIDIAYITV